MAGLEKNALNHTEQEPVRQEKCGINILFSSYLNGSTSAWWLE